ncbi:hypothetical protein GCM10010404_81620 [Nonomuraea africana]|uniref:Uncharacterized protein n=1 Tax=Nonomuraea africana TaxID=46171 RepID=A0ABR9KX44_9ACTN|nr:hypothetical protein [Nonomuraea africana]MBE1566603.1 hypothetical protein [Nonomuraea africana]
MFEVHGYVDGVAYAVTVGRARPEAAATTGIVSGSPKVVGLLAGRQGADIVFPHQPVTALDVREPVSVLAALQAWTQVVKIVRE